MTIMTDKTAVKFLDVPKIARLLHCYPSTTLLTSCGSATIWTR
jgi:hypothetical protein